MAYQKTIVPLIGRILIAAIFLISGFGKIGAPAMTQGYIASAGLPAPLLAYLIAIVVEVGGGILLVVGFQTRIVALVMAVFTVATAVFFREHRRQQSVTLHRSRSELFDSSLEGRPSLVLPSFCAPVISSRMGNPYPV